jgi:hypothetical protein
VRIHRAQEIRTVPAAASRQPAPNSISSKSAAVSTRIAEAIAPTKPKRSRHNQTVRGFSAYWFVTVGEQPSIPPSVSWIAKSSFEPASTSIGRQNSRQSRLS